MSSLNMEVSLWDLTTRMGSRFSKYGERDSYWFERDLKKGRDYLAGPVRVINFDYLENN
jgi:hypothetical protein